MPSWDLHNKWAKRMGIPLLISKEVNKIIDSLFEHDLGRNIKKPICGRTLIRRDGEDSIYAEPPKIIISTEPELRKILGIAFSDDVKLRHAFKAAILHHRLDGMAKAIEMYGTRIVSDIKYIVDRSRELRPIYLDERAYRDVEEFIKKNAKEIVHDIARELLRKGVLDIGPETFFEAFNEFRKRNKWPGWVYTGKTQLIKAASYKIYHELKKGKKVSFYFAYIGASGRRTRASPVFELESIEGAMNLFGFS